MAGKVVMIYVKGGRVQEVEAPDGTTVVVKDYDSEGIVDDVLLKQDKNGWYLKCEYKF